VKQAVERVRKQARTHAMSKGHAYRAKLNIMKTTFLSKSTDEETADFI
jgi:hypothetical protein